MAARSAAEDFFSDTVSFLATFLSALLRPRSGRANYSDLSKRTFTDPSRAFSRIKIRFCTCTVVNF